MNSVELLRKYYRGEYEEVSIIWNIINNMHPGTY